MDGASTEGAEADYLPTSMLMPPKVELSVLSTAVESSNHSHQGKIVTPIAMTNTTMQPPQVHSQPARRVDSNGGVGSSSSSSSSRRILPEQRNAATIRKIASQRWLKAEEVLDVLEHAPDYGIQPEKSVVTLPVEGSLFLFKRTALRGFRLDGHNYRKKNQGRQLDETHCKLKVDGVPRLVCYYSWLTDGSLARRIYTIIDDKELALVHYFRQDAGKPPQQNQQNQLQQPLLVPSVELQNEIKPAPRLPPPPSQAQSTTQSHPQRPLPTAQQPLVDTAWRNAAADSRMSALEERIRQLELENAALKQRSQLASGEQVAVVFGATSAGVDAPEMLPPHLAILDVSPGWDSVSGGGKVLVATRTQPDTRYGGSFGFSRTAVAPATVVLPNVLSITVPPSATGTAGPVPFKLFRLSPNGEILEISKTAYPFHYREPLMLSGSHRDSISAAGLGLRSAGVADSMVSDDGEEEDEEDEEDEDEDEHAVAELAAAAEEAQIEVEAAVAAEEAAAAAEAAEAAAGDAAIPREVFALALSLTSSLTSSANTDALDEQFRMLISSLGDRSGDLQRHPHDVGLQHAQLPGVLHEPRSSNMTHSTFGSTFGTVSTANSSRAGSSASSRSLSSHLDLLDWHVEPDADRRLRWLQRMVRQRLRHKSMPRSGTGSSGPLTFARRNSGDGEVEAAAAQVQRVFRNRRQDSRRRAVLAIEKFYLRRRRGPGAYHLAPRVVGASTPSGSSDRVATLTANPRAACLGGALTSTEKDSAALAPLKASCSPPRFLSSGGGSSSSSPMLHATGGLAPLPLAPLPEASMFAGPVGSETASGERLQAPGNAEGNAMVTDDGSSQEVIDLGQAALIRHAQHELRTRILRRKAVRVIESAWKDWQFHSEQANTAARDTGSTPFHAFHAERRERAARIIQGYLQRQADAADPGRACSHEGALDGSVAEAGSSIEKTSEGQLYTVEEIEMLRRLQRNFRSHLRSQAAEAEEVLEATRSASDQAGDAGNAYDRLCRILRKCSLDGPVADLSDDEQSVLTKLQQAVRDHLERKRATQ